MAITNDEELKSFIETLPFDGQRRLGALFIDNVLDLARDQRVPAALEWVKIPGTAKEVLENALHTAREAVFSTNAPCGRELDFLCTAAHYVALATVACLQPKESFPPGENPACKAAIHCRQARSFALLAQGGDAMGADENLSQYRAAEGFGTK